MPAVSEPSIFDDLFAEIGMPALMHYVGTRFTYRAKTGSKRDIEAIAIYEENAVREDEIEERRQERLWIAVYRDPNLGIAAPQLGDSGWRDGDEADSPWSFQGEVRNESAKVWELLFARIRPQRYGPKTT